MKRILIVEDNEDNMELCLLVLERDFDVITSFNGKDGLSKIYSEAPDLILLDMSLPDVSGIEITKEIKANEKLKHIPIIALTALGERCDRVQAMESGCDEYLEKPFEIKRLMDMVREFL